MDFAYYETKTLTDFENELKTLSLNKKYTFSKDIEVLKEDEILEKSNSHERETLKVFKDNAQITTYHLKSHKSNYLFIVGETETPNIIGLTVIFDKKPFKQIRRDYAPMNYFILKTLGIEDPNVIFDNKLEEIEYKDVSTIMQKLHIHQIVV
ncbi:hypothetical protein ASS99_08900 [Staphylococcus equorum]|nr:hypothetical protein ASS99_08900 [Staphylococcus equorum]